MMLQQEAVKTSGQRNDSDASAPLICTQMHEVTVQPNILLARWYGAQYQLPNA
jgi:hypothetical protein